MTDHASTIDEMRLAALRRIRELVDRIILGRMDDGETVDSICLAVRAETCAAALGQTIEAYNASTEEINERIRAAGADWKVL